MLTTIIRRIRKNRILALILFLGTFLFLGCNKQDVFFEYHSIPKFIWNQDFVTNINYEIDDTIQGYNSYIHIRHNDEYPYQNLWLVLEEKLDSVIVSKDTLQIVLADKYGKWLGSGVGAIREISIPYKQDFLFAKSGNYELFITHMMKTDNLEGIQDVGLRIEKVE